MTERSTSGSRPGHRRHTAIVLLLLLLGSPAVSQVLPDRIVTLDPLADHSLDTSGTSWLNGARLYAEFSRYTSGDDDHRWNARIGGVAEMIRWDSTADISIVGTMEVVVDPNNDIAFNPRAIYWEEGLLAGVRLAGDLSLQAGYVHRCKHDIDNLEIVELTGRREQRTLIYSGLLTRLSARELRLVERPWALTAATALRNDLFLHLLDDRRDGETRGVGTDVEALVDALSLTARLDAGPAGGRWRLRASVSLMATALGAERGFAERFDDITILGSVPFAELGIELFNPNGSAFTLYVRGEWQRDSGVRSVPTSASLGLIGVRVSDARWMW